MNHKCQTNSISLDFEVLVEHNETFEDITSEATLTSSVILGVISSVSVWSSVVLLMAAV